jgi:hypothetical protein
VVGVNRAYTVVSWRVPPVYGIVIEEEYPDPFVMETEKSVGDVIVRVPLAGNRFVPETENDLSLDVLTLALPKDKEVGVIISEDEPIAPVVPEIATFVRQRYFVELVEPSIQGLILK